MPLFYTSHVRSAEIITYDKLTILYQLNYIKYQLSSLKSIKIYYS